MLWEDRLGWKFDAVEAMSRLEHSFVKMKERSSLAA